MTDVYAPCLCGSGKKLKFCCYGTLKKGNTTPVTTEFCKFPIYECKVLKHWKESGISPVYVVRELTKDSYVFISYLVDFFCLGVKDTTFKLGVSKMDLMNIYNRDDELETISYQDARSLILGAVDFAKSIDIAPHHSWSKIPYYFVEAHLEYNKKFTFGKEGVPYYFSGPYDYEHYNVDEIIEKVSIANGHIVVMYA